MVCSSELGSARSKLTLRPTTNQDHQTDNHTLLRKKQGKYKFCHTFCLLSSLLILCNELERSSNFMKRFIEWINIKRFGASGAFGAMAEKLERFIIGTSLRTYQQIILEITSPKNNDYRLTELRSAHEAYDKSLALLIKIRKHVLQRELHGNIFEGKKVWWKYPRSLTNALQYI